MDLKSQTIFGHWKYFNSKSLLMMVRFIINNVKDNNGTNILLGRGFNLYSAFQTYFNRAIAMEQN